MKLGMLTSTDERCGISQYTRDLCSGFGPDIDLDIVPVHMPSEPWLCYIEQSAGRLNRCDVVHIQHEYSFWGSILPGKNRYFTHMKSIDRPKVITAHTLDSVDDMLAVSKSGGARVIKPLIRYIPGYRRMIEVGTFDLADRIIVHDKPCADILAGRGISRDKLRIVPMGVPEPDLDPSLGAAFREKHGLRDKRLIVIFGFIRPGRGYETVLDFLPELGKDTVLVIAGGTQNPAQDLYLEELNAGIRRRSLEKRVLITGYLSDEDVAGVMQSADVVLCSQESGTGSYSVQVALGYGRPIAASDLPCFADLESTCGCLVTFRRSDPQDMMCKIKSVMTDSGTASGLSDKAHAYAREHTWRKVAARTEAVYHELCGK
ncbi:MAG: glycosyltransferase [Armatimonadota bacterium]